MRPLTVTYIIIDYQLIELPVPVWVGVPAMEGDPRLWTHFTGFLVLLVARWARLSCASFKHVAMQRIQNLRATFWLLSTAELVQHCIATGYNITWKLHSWNFIGLCINKTAELAKTKKTLDCYQIISFVWEWGLWMITIYAAAGAPPSALAQQPAKYLSDKYILLMIMQ